MSSRYRKEDIEGRHLRMSAKRKRNKGGNLAAWRKKCRELQTADCSTSTLDIAPVKAFGCISSTPKADISLQEQPTSNSSDLLVTPNFHCISDTQSPNLCTPQTSPKHGQNDQVKFELSGRRIVDLDYFVNQIQLLNNHSVFGCTFSDMKPVSENRKGLNSGITFKCEMCNFGKTIWTNEASKSSLGINTAAVIGTTGVGIGFSNMEEFLSILNIPCMSINTYTVEHDRVSDAWEKTAQVEMEQAVMEEKELAEERGDIDADGIPLLTVIVDGTWAKRSYRTNYSSLSGAAAIIGYNTKKVLYLGVRNKYCATCASSKRKNVPPADHTCFKNWSGSSSGMEADIIVEGFCQSMKMYGVKYIRMIGDGDSSVYKKILDSRPYDSVMVEKVECKNHLLRNFCNKLKEIAKSSKLGHIHLRKLLTSNIIRLRVAIIKASQYRNTGDVLKLRADILNSPMHIFGDHKNCEEYYCSKERKEEKNYVLELRESGIFSKIMEVVNGIAYNAKSLLFNATNNAVEEFNSIVAKHIGGKRINFCQKRSYQTRCNASVVSHNTRKKYNKIHHLLTDKSPGQYCKKRENAQIRRITLSKGRMSQKRGLKRKTLFPQDKDYGPNSEKPDLPPEEFEEKRQRFLVDLTKTSSDIEQLERRTVLQKDCPLWAEERRKRLTASIFGVVCNKLPSTSCASTVKTILYRHFDTPGMRYGRQHEKDALKSLEEAADINIKQCGFFIDKELFFLGASPDGIVENDNDCIVEVKCPKSCENMSPTDAILQRKFTFWNVDKDKKNITGINRKHQYFFQVQGQLRVTRRKYCLFALWTQKGMKFDRIERDDLFWKHEMEDKLTKFYHDCLLPEIVDARHSRSMPIRDPAYIVEAQKELENKRKKVKAA